MMKTSFVPKLGLACIALAAGLATTLAACSDKAADKKPGQALASVNGEEVTVLQLNEELQRANVGANQQDTASKQLLQVLIDRQLLQEAAARENLDRDPKVMQAVDRARSLIVAQAYLQKRIGNVARPTPEEVEAYFNKNPDFFARRKQFSMDELVIAGADLTPEVRAAADRARSLEEVGVWLDAHKIKYGRTQVTRSTADVPRQLSEKLLGMPKGQLFVVREGTRAMFVTVAEVKDAPVSLQVAMPQIEQFLMKRKNQELATDELKRLRSGASIVYLNKAMMPGAKEGAQPAAARASAPAQAPASAPADGVGSTDKAALDRGVAGLK
jgi:EpsD family peptidyl-prolyl cis-trans isomerase